MEYKYNIDLKDVSFVEVQQRDYKFSSRGREKRGRGIETYRIGHKFIEFNYLDGSVKRIHCNAIMAQVIGSSTLDAIYPLPHQLRQRRG